MAFFEMNDFMFEVPGYVPPTFGAPTFPYPCEPLTVGVGETVPVRVIVSVSVSNIVIEAQQVTVQAATTVSVQNPVRVKQQVTQSVTVGEVQPNGNPVLEDFVKNQNATGSTVFVPKKFDLDKYMTEAWNKLGRQVGVEVATNGEVAQTLAETGDDFGKIVDRLKKVPPRQAQQILQRVGVPFDKAQQIAQNVISGAADDAAAGLRELLSRSQTVTLLRDVINFNNIKQAVGC